MKNKNILYALLGVGALVGLYFWIESKKNVKKAEEQRELQKSMLLANPT